MEEFLIEKFGQAPKEVTVKAVSFADAAFSIWVA